MEVHRLRARQVHVTGDQVMWAALVFGLVIAAAVLGLNPRRGTDFHIYQRAAQRFWDAKPLYPVSDGAMPFKYAPAVAWMFSWAAQLPSEWATAVWNVFSVLVFAWAAHGWLVYLERDEELRPRYMAALVATLALGQSVFLELFYGQVDLVMLVLLVLSVTLSGRRWFSMAGAVLACAVLLKPTAVLVGVGFLLIRRARVLGWAAFFGAAFFLPVVARYGVHGTVEQLSAWSATLHRTTAPWVLGYNPQGLPTLLLGVVLPANAQPTQGVLALVTTAVLLGMAALAAVRLRGASMWSFLFLCVAYASPLAWRANFILAWPLLTWLATRRPRLDQAMAVGFLTGVAVLQWTVTEAVMGTARLQALMLWRPWAWVFALVLVWTLARPSYAEAEMELEPSSF
jgi:hypothetical protein